MFNSLGNFNPSAAVSLSVLAKARAFYEQLKTHYPCPAGTIKRIYGHSSAGHYGQDFPEYNGSIRYGAEAKDFFFDVTHNPQDNAIGVNDNQPASHTYMRNTGAFGLATDDMVFATTTAFGPEPITLMAAEFLSAGIGAVAAAYEIDLAGLVPDTPYAGEPAFLTHAEAANHPGNPAQYANYYVTGERWDWAGIVPFPSGLTFSQLSPAIVGNALRQKGRSYKIAILQGGS